MPRFNTPTRQLDGPSASTDWFDVDAEITLANAATLLQGQVVCIDVTQLLGAKAASPQCEQVVVSTSANAGRPYGVYQGATITNATGASQVYKISVRCYGYGVVWAGTTGPTALTVSSNLIVSGATTSAIPGTAALYATIGQTMATGATVAVGSTIIGGTHAPLLVNAFIDCE